MAFVSYKDSVVHFDGDLSVTDHAKLKSVIERLKLEHHARLLAKYPDRPWWPDVVYLARDIKSTCELLTMLEQQPIAMTLADMFGQSAAKLLDHLNGVIKDDDEYNESANLDARNKTNLMLEQLSQDAEELDALTERELMREFGQPGTIQD